MEAAIDWRQDEWFAKHYAHRVTPAFEEWWTGYYGRPEDYGEDSFDQETQGVPFDGERHEYFVRAAFALAGYIQGATETAAALTRRPRGS